MNSLDLMHSSFVESFDSAYDQLTESRTAIVHGIDDDDDAESLAIYLGEQLGVVKAHYTTGEGWTEAGPIVIAYEHGFDDVYSFWIIDKDSV